MKRIIYNRESVRVRYEDCRLPIAAILSNLNDIFISNRHINIEEGNGCLYFNLEVKKYNDVVHNKTKWIIFQKTYEIKDVITKLISTNIDKEISIISMYFVVHNYKKINSNFIKSHKGIGKFNL